MRQRKKGPPFDVRYFLEEIGVDAPSDRDMAPVETQANWPEGWWAVSDPNAGYIAFFANGADATAFKFMLVGMIASGKKISRRYR